MQVICEAAGRWDKSKFYEHGDYEHQQRSVEALAAPVCGRSLLVLCTAFRARADRYPTLTVKKIPKQVLSRSEWGHDDYSLRLENLPKAPPPKG